MSNNNKDIDSLFDSNSNKRIEELKNHPEFKKLPYNQQIILLTGEKLLEMDFKLRNHTSEVKNYFNKLSKKQIVSKEGEAFSADVIKDLVREETIKVIKENNDFSKLIDEEKLMQMIQQKYNEELYNLEDKFENITQETIKTFDESISDALERMETLSQFEIKAREDIQKNQDAIYLLEEKFERQREENVNLKNEINDRLDDIESNSNGCANFGLLNFESDNSKFESIEQLMSYIKEQSHKIAQEEVENYMHDFNLFNDDREEYGERDIETLIQENFIKEAEISKVYEIQMQNHRKLDQLQNLLDQQNRQIRSLDEDRQQLIFALEDVFKEKDVDIEKLLSTKPFENYNSINLDISSDLQDNKYSVNQLLSKEEIEILVKKEAIELIKEKIAKLEKASIQRKLEVEASEAIGDATDIDVDNINLSNEVQNKIDCIKTLSTDDKQILDYLEETNEKIRELEANLKMQIQENINLKNDLFDEISKNGTSDIYTINHENNVMINDEIISNLNTNYIIEMSEEDMKHNYYNGTFPIPGTKITRINNYKINSEIDQTSYEDAQKLIKEESTRITTSNVENNNVVEEPIVPENNAWQESNQKLLDLENLIIRQEEEIRRLKQEKVVEPQQQEVYPQENNKISKNEIEFLIKQEAMKIVKDEMRDIEGINKNSNNNFVLSEIDDAIKTTLKKLQELSSMQQKTIDDIEHTNKKIQEIESQLKTDGIKSTEIEEELARIELDKLIEEKYKINNQYKEANYADELRKIEDERRKIEETLELERIRLLTEIENNRRQMQELSENTKVEYKPQPQQQIEEVKAIPIVEEVKKEEPKEVQHQHIILEAPKKKRKQQVFYEVKVHSTPKLTRADLEK